MHSQSVIIAQLYDVILCQHQHAEMNSVHRFAFDQRQHGKGERHIIRLLTFS